MKTPQTGRTLRRLPRFAALLMMGCLCLLPSERSQGRAAKETAEVPTLVYRMTARNLNASLAALRTLLPFPLTAEGVLKAIPFDLGSQIVLTEPIEVAIGLDTRDPERVPESMVAFSIETKGYPQLIKHLTEQGQAPKSTPLGTKFAVNDASDHWLCQAMPSTKRVACGLVRKPEHEELTLALAVALLKSKLPVSRADLHAVLLVDSITDAYQDTLQGFLQVGAMAIPSRLQTGRAALDRAITDSTQTVLAQVQGVLKDLRRLEFDIDLLGQQTDAKPGQMGVNIRFRYVLGSQQSWWGAQDAALVQQTATQTPAAFFLLPATAETAAFSHTNGQYLMRMAQGLTGLLAEYLAEEKLSPKDRQDLMQMLQGIWPKDPVITTVSAQLHTAPRGKNNGGAEVDWTGLLSGVTYLTGTGDTPDRQTSMTSLVAVLNRPSIAAFLRAKWKALDLPGAPPTLRMWPAPKTLPAGTQKGSFVFTMPKNVQAILPSSDQQGSRGDGAKAKVGKSVSLYWLSAHVQGMTWTALGTDPLAAQQVLETQLLSKNSAGLGGPGQPDLDVLREPGLRSGGFVTLASLGNTLWSALKESQGKYKKLDAGGKFDNLFNVLPHHGETRMVYRSRVRPGNDPVEVQGETLLQVPRTTVEDVVAAVLHLAQ